MKALLKLVIVLSSSILVGCATGPEAQSGTVIGGVLGAATGGIVGHQSGRGLEGAAIGGGIGAVAGNIFGNAQDTRRQYYSQPQYRVPQQVVYCDRPSVVYYQRPQVVYSSPVPVYPVYR